MELGGLGAGPDRTAFDRSRDRSPPGSPGLLGWSGANRPRSAGVTARRAALLAVAAIALLLLSGLATIDLGSSPTAAPTPPTGIGSPVRVAEARSSSSAPIVERAPPGFPSTTQCSVLPVRGCPELDRALGMTPKPLASDPLSSWVNITPTPYPVSYPAARYANEMAYDPVDSMTLMFGGGGGAPNYPIYNDLWGFRAGNWTNLTPADGCSATTCPSPREYAAFAYDLTDREALLFGGLGVIDGTSVTLGDTWVYADGSWSNITATAGTPPVPRLDASMSFVSDEGYVLLFGGTNLSGAYFNDSWSFVHGQWANITGGQLDEPGPSMGASLADSPDGYAMLFGGYGPYGFVQPTTGSCVSYAQYWFSDGTWTHAEIVCAHTPRGFTSSNWTTLYDQPCGRIGAALSWSPKNQHFVLYGGEGYPASGGACPTAGTASNLNDTYLYLGPLGGAYEEWQTDLAGGWPADRSFMASAPDYRDGYVVMFGGVLDNLALTNDTWRYYAQVNARLSGPTTIDTSGATMEFPIFTITAFGGSGDLAYEFNWTPERTTNVLSGPGCENFTDGQGHPVPPTGVREIQCTPSPTNYNIFRLEMQVWDLQNGTARAFANWTFTAAPPEALDLYSQYAGILYQNISMTDELTVYAQIANQPVQKIYGLVSYGTVVDFTHTTSSDFWWNGTVNVTNLPLNAEFEVAVWSLNWSENASLPLEVASVPSFLSDFINFPGVTSVLKTTGTGPFDLNYTNTQTVDVPLAKVLPVLIPTNVSLISGAYSLMPELKVVTSESSTGAISLAGTVGEQLPSISLGGGNLTISASVTLTGVLHVGESAGVETIVWVSSSLALTLTGTVSASFPIWGYTFNILGKPITIGFSATISVAPSITLDLLMSPASTNAEALGGALDFAITSIIGSFSLPISAAINFGIGIASVSLGGTLGVAVLFGIAPGPFSPTAIWINGTVFAKAQFLFWSATWNFIGPGTIYTAQLGYNEQPRSDAGGGLPAQFNNGSSAAWGLAPRPYNVTGYDRLVWSPLNASGPAITDIYPEAAPSVTSAYSGATVFYSNDQVGEPVQNGLTVSGLALNASTNDATAVPSPVDPGFVVSAPEAATLPNGSEYVVWRALPDAEATGTTPLGVRTIALHGAPYDPRSGSWGTIRDFTTSGIAQSYSLDASSPVPIAVVLVTGTLLPGGSSPEWLDTFNLTTGAVVSNASVQGFSSIGSVRGAADGASAMAALQYAAGNDTLVALSSGAVVPLAYTPPAGTKPDGVQYVGNSPSMLLLRYREPTSELAVLVPANSGTPLATLRLPGDVTDVAAYTAGSATIVYAGNGSGLAGWSVGPTGAVSPLSGVPVSGLSTFGIAQVGSSVLLYGLVPDPTGPSGGQSLFLAEVGVGLPLITAGEPAPGGSTTSPSPSTPSNSVSPFNWALYLGIPLVAAAAVLVILAVVTRRRPPAAPAAAPFPSPGPTPPPSPPPPPTMPPPG